MSSLLSGVHPSLLVPLWSVGGVAIGVDKLAVTRPSPKVRLCASSWAGGIFHRCQERRYGVGDGARGAPGQVMTCAWHELQASVRQSAGEPAAGIDGNQGVLRVGEQEHRRLDGRDGLLQLTQFAQKGALLGQERAPERGVLAARLAPDLPVDMLVRARRAAAPPADLGQPGTGDPWRQPPDRPAGVVGDDMVRTGPASYRARRSQRRTSHPANPTSQKLAKR
jgi:hypothetical protein